MKQALPILNGTMMKTESIHTKESMEDFYQSLSVLFLKQNSKAIIRNVNTEIKLLKIGEKYVFPVSINSIQENNSFVCSPHTAYALYSKDELKQKVNNKLLQIPVLGIINFIDLILRLGKIDKNIHINNFLLSTNPYPEWDGKEIGEITDELLKEYPKHAIIFRSLNEYQHQEIISKFEDRGYIKLGSRQVYIYDTDYDSWIKRNNNRNDIRLIKKQKLRYISHEEMYPYLEEALELYNKLYLLKYSQFNPQFTVDYFRISYEQKLIHFQGYVDDKNKLKSFAGLFIIENTITSPLVGYDTDAPQKEGLYIHAIHLIFLYKFKSGLLLNLSSGASLFKRMRGGQASIEYSLIYTRHLSFGRKLIWKTLQFVSNKIGIPILNKYEL